MTAIRKVGGIASVSTVVALLLHGFGASSGAMWVGAGITFCMAVYVEKW